MSELKDNEVALGVFTAILMVAGVAGMVLLLFFRKDSKLPVSTPAQSRRGVAIAKTSPGLIIAVTVQTIYLVMLILSTKA
jgi:hypothetical protein